MRTLYQCVYYLAISLLHSLLTAHLIIIALSLRGILKLWGIFLFFIWISVLTSDRFRVRASFSSYEIAYKYRTAPRRMPNVINRGHSSSWPMFLFAWCRLTDGFAAFRECCRGRCESTRKLDSRHLKQMKGGGTGRKKEAESLRNKRNIYGERQHARLARRRKGAEVLALVR